MSRRKGKGDCFEVAGRMVLHDRDLVLCHGVATGQGGIEGVRFWHAWCERTFQVPFPDLTTRPMVMAVDHANGTVVELPVGVYLKVGDIREVFRYTAEEASVLMLRTGHWGPWVEDWEAMAR